MSVFFCCEAGSTEQEESKQSWSKSFSQSFELSFSSNFDGPSVLNPSGYVPLENGEPDYQNPASFSNILLSGYKVSGRVVIGGALNFDYRIGAEPGFILRDPGLRVRVKELLVIGKFKVDSDFRIFFPVTSESRSAGRVLGLQWFQTSTYQFGLSPFYYNSYSELRWNWNNSIEIPSHFTISFAPGIYYALSDLLNPFVLFQAQCRHSLNQSSFLSQDYLQAAFGVGFELSETLSIEPYLAFPIENPTLNAVALGGYIFARIF